MLSQASQPTRFAVDATRIGVEHAVLTVAGEVDLATVDRLQHHLTRLLTSGIRFLVMDMSAVGFVGSVGLEAIIDSHDHTRVHGGWLILIDPPAIMIRLLALLEPTKRFTSYPSIRQSTERVQRLSAATTVRRIGASLPRANSARPGACGATPRAPSLLTTF